MANSYRDWASLPQLVLDLIITKIQSLPDHVRFASVCTSWLSVQKARTKAKVPVPMLLLPNIDTKSSSTTTTTLQSLEDDKNYNIGVPSVHNTTRFCGSSHGWLIAVETDHFITLSPQTPRKQRQKPPTIRLPPIKDTRRYHGERLVNKSDPEYIHKMILSADPGESKGYVAVAIYGCWSHLAILKSVDNSWTCSDSDCCLFADVIWHKNNLYAVTLSGDVFQINGDNPSPQLLTLFFPQKATRYTSLSHGYFVESSWGQLLMVQRYSNSRTSNYCEYSTSHFRVYKLQLSTTIEVKKIRVQEIGGDALFIDNNQCMVVGASKIRGFCLKNCICYTADLIRDFLGCPVGPIGIFSLENKTVQVKYLPGLSSTLVLPPIWVTPMVLDLVQI